MLGKKIYFSCLKQPVCTGLCHTPPQCEVCTNGGRRGDLARSLSVVTVLLSIIVL